MGNKSSMIDNPCFKAAYRGNLQALEEAIACGYPCDQWLCALAADQGGHTDIIEYAKRNRWVTYDGVVRQREE